MCGGRECVEVNVNNYNSPLSSLDGKNVSNKVIDVASADITFICVQLERKKERIFIYLP
jgi:hypothetical protein